ncbi:hypothetical protein [Adhaeribacter rhizoryzae]|uniref:Uncharacterized protein n=1 Tax=Adhaeribacter rhizoryzae TaxID=2607907 RepID=A0A5M6CVA4_9BACT|nr:hypothetical protein [Adhaeribacter rhizoryzae]KAA5539131.1 hypothetical protein F0145_25010 [Adhaeribacter rhizoryzae]
MNLYQFNRHNIQGRAALIWRQGIFFDFRDEGEYRIILHDMGNFYAELWYDADMHHIKHVRGFRSLECLEPYLATIKLADMMV